MAAKANKRVQVLCVVDPDGTRLEARRELTGSREVLTPYDSSKAVFGVIWAGIILR